MPTRANRRFSKTLAYGGEDARHGPDHSTFTKGVFNFVCRQQITTGLVLPPPQPLSLLEG